LREVEISRLLQAQQSPTGQKHRNADGKETRIGPERPGGEQIDEQDPHPRDLSRSRQVIQALRHVRQIRSKFFSTSRRLRRSMTGRPCGQTVEYAVADSSLRMCAIFS
jgi:hypothetical protein